MHERARVKQLGAHGPPESKAWVKLLHGNSAVIGFGALDPPECVNFFNRSVILYVLAHSITRDQSIPCTVTLKLLTSLAKVFKNDDTRLLYILATRSPKA